MGLQLEIFLQSKNSDKKLVIFMQIYIEFRSKKRLNLRRKSDYNLLFFRLKIGSNMIPKRFAADKNQPSTPASNYVRYITGNAPMLLQLPT